MTTVLCHVKAFWDEQHIKPRGVAGRIIGERMARQHRPETDWTLSLLDVSPTDRVLEIGFGAGRALELIARRVTYGYITGIDVSDTMLAAARRRNAKTVAEGRMVMLQGNVTYLPFASEQFDKILSIHTFYFWPEPLQTMEQLFRLLKPHGKLVITLSTGVIGPEGTYSPGQFGTLHASLEEHIIPGMRDIGFKAAYLKRGPDNRQYNSVAAIGIK